MVGKFHKLAASVVTTALALSLGVTGISAQEAKKQKQVKDQAEYDLLQLVNKETVPAKKIELLDQWKQKYPESEFKEDRAMVYVQTYQQKGDAGGMWKSCEDVLALAPKNPQCLFFLTSLTGSMNDPSKYDDGAKYIQRFLDELPVIYKDKPATDKDRMSGEALARKTLGLIAMNRKEFTKAEQIFTDFLKWNPNSGNVSYSLGNAILMQKDKTKQIPALWHLARAAYYTGDDALPDASKKQLQAFFEKTYVNYHGSKEGLQEVIDAALKAPFPPEGWKIESEGEKRAREMEKIKTENPQLYLWLQIKEGLTGPGSADYWNQLKGSAMPKLKGKVISATPPARPKELIVGISNADMQEVKLILDTPAGKVEPGLEIEFEEAVAKDFTADPFMLTADAEFAKVAGLPKGGPAPRAMPKKAAGKKK